MGLLVLGLALTGCRPAGDPERVIWRWRARPAEAARIGDRVHFELTLEHPADWEIEWPEPATNAGWRVLSQASATRDLRGARRQSRRQYEAVSFQAGAEPVFTNAAIARLPDGTARAIRPPTNTFVIRDQGLDAAADLDDFLPPRGLPGRWPPWLTALLSVAGATILIALLARR
ncbi:MAG: hypothetical protein K9N49_06365, partial [Candidatus Marinimicrobia bacterium]|nr:hypothetical protein [Candidatus Neomarinimicrobiota bacterium]